jgi:hypothetical protein
MNPEMSRPEGAATPAHLYQDIEAFHADLKKGFRIPEFDKIDASEDIVTHGITNSSTLMSLWTMNDQRPERMHPRR